MAAAGVAVAVAVAVAVVGAWEHRGSVVGQGELPMKQIEKQRRAQLSGLEKLRNSELCPILPGQSSVRNHIYTLLVELEIFIPPKDEARLALQIKTK